MRELMKGNHAIGEAAVRAGCRFFAGYPITPQTELLEYMAWRLPQVGGGFVQAESEITAICMVYGAAATGVFSMTASSGPGFSLMQEGLSYAAAARLPIVVVDVMRSVPGLGSIDPAQSDYFQATKGGGHGDYRCLVFAPASVQEAAQLMYESFDQATRYRIPYVLLVDGAVAQLFEPVELPPLREVPVRPAWAIDGSLHGQKKRVGMTVYVNSHFMEDMRAAIRSAGLREQRHESYMLEGAETVIVAYGVMGRLAKAVVRKMRSKGLPVGLFRPVSLWPFPARGLRACASGGSVRRIVVTEMSLGQMVEDVLLALRKSRLPVFLFTEAEGRVPAVEDVERFVVAAVSGSIAEVEEY